MAKGLLFPYMWNRPKLIFFNPLGWCRMGLFLIGMKQIKFFL